jgi:hypothetical protein
MQQSSNCSSTPNAIHGDSHALALSLQFCHAPGHALGGHSCSVDYIQPSTTCRPSPAEGRSPRTASAADELSLHGVFGSKLLKTQNSICTIFLLKFLSHLVTCLGFRPEISLLLKFARGTGLTLFPS